MDVRCTARLFPELSNFYCHPGRAGGSPSVTRIEAHLGGRKLMLGLISRFHVGTW
jgi:hypothetical protein